MFTKIATAEKVKTVTGETVIIEKFRKDGTKREFFTPTIDGKQITKTMFARLYDARSFSLKLVRKAI